MNSSPASTNWITMSMSRASIREPSRATRTSTWTASPVRNRVVPVSVRTTGCACRSTGTGDQLGRPR